MKTIYQEQFNWNWHWLRLSMINGHKIRLFESFSMECSYRELTHFKVLRIDERNTLTHTSFYVGIGFWLLCVLQISQRHSLHNHKAVCIWFKNMMSSRFIERASWKISYFVCQNCSALQNFQCYEFSNLEHTSVKQLHDILKFAELFLLFFIRIQVDRLVMMYDHCI